MLVVVRQFLWLWSPGAQSFQPQWKCEDHSGGLWHQVQPGPLPGSEGRPRHPCTLGLPAGQRRLDSLN